MKNPIYGYNNLLKTASSAMHFGINDRINYSSAYNPVLTAVRVHQPVHHGLQAISSKKVQPAQKHVLQAEEPEHTQSVLPILAGSLAGGYILSKYAFLL